MSGRPMMGAEKRTTLSVTLSPRAIRAAKTCAALRGLSVSGLIERLIWSEVAALSSKSKDPEEQGTGEKPTGET